MKLPARSWPVTWAIRYESYIASPGSTSAPSVAAPLGGLRGMHLDARC